MRLKKRFQETQKKRMSKRGLAIVLVYTLYLLFIFLSRMPLLAEMWVDPEMKEIYETRLSFPTDGKQSHYEVERYSQSSPGYIHVIYYTANNTLNIDAINIKKLSIDCRSMYEDECKEVFGIDPEDDSNYYKIFFIEKDNLKVHVNTDNKITHLEFKDTPMPYEVRVNGESWVANVDYSYTNNHGTIISEVPSGHSWVDIFFKSTDTACPIARFKVTETKVGIYESITFDASESIDPDGRIANYFWDFGDGNFVSGTEITSHHYTKVGTYGVILTIRDEDHLLDREYKNVTVIPEQTENSTLAIKGKIPNQEMYEDCEPWTLHLNDYESIFETTNNPFNWWVTGENRSLYTIVGENSSADKLIFKPVNNAFGNNRITVWLGDNKGIRDNQTIWVNITSVNDAPTIFGAPDLVIRYDEPYTFNFEPYINDVETPKEELMISTSDPNHVEVLDGLNLKFMYSKRLFGETVYVILTVSDGEDTSDGVICITVSDDWVPILTKQLPDVYLSEGEAHYNYFDLDDYYSDPDGDSLYYSFGYTHIKIKIHDNHSVDFIAPDNWGGREIVTFRAMDPAGAIAEDIVVVNVEAINDAPVINGVPNLVVHYGEVYQFDLLPYVEDEDNTLDELIVSTSERIDGEWTDSAKTGYIHTKSNNNLILIINYPKMFLDRTVLVKIIVSDGDLFGSQLISVWITANYPPELTRPLPDISFFEDSVLSKAIHLPIYFLDRDYDDLYYSKGEKRINITIDTDGYVSLSAEENWYGSEIVTFRATDPAPYQAIAEDTILITVIPVNDAPVIDVIPTQSGKVGDTWVLDLREYVHDVDNNITELNITLDTNGMDCKIKGTDLIFYGTTAAKKPINLEVNDGDKNTNQTILVIISQPSQKKSDLLILNLIGALIVGFVASIFIVSYRKYKSHYTIEEIFLIHKGGDLISHKTRKIDTQVDEDILSAMFTVVQDFIKDSFAKRAASGKNWALEELKIGENKILIDRGRFVYLTVIFSGSSLAGKKLRKRTKTMLKSIEKEYRSVIRKWTGKMDEVDELDKTLSELLPDEKK